MTIAATASSSVPDAMKVARKPRARGQERADERPDEAAYRRDRRGQTEDGPTPFHRSEMGDECVGRGDEAARGDTHQRL